MTDSHCTGRPRRSVQTARPFRQRRVCGGLATVVLSAALSMLWPLPSAAQGTAGVTKGTDRPPAGRYRCYQPPGYTVVSWFDLEADGTYHLLGDDPAPSRYEPASRRVVWLKGEHARRGWIGLYLPPAADSAGGIRHTIVMTTAGNLKPPANDRDRRLQCYLKTN